MAMMKEFKPASTLHDDFKRRTPPSRRGPASPSFRKSKTRKCEHHDQGICEASREAVRLGLREEAITCNGNIPPDCKIRQKLEAGMTVKELFVK